MANTLAHYDLVEVTAVKVLKYSKLGGLPQQIQDCESKRFKVRNTGDVFIFFEWSIKLECYIKLGLKGSSVNNTLAYWAHL